MDKIIYNIQKPIKLNNHFEVPADDTKWDLDDPYKELKNDMMVPNRLRKINFDDLLIPKTNYCEQFCNYGLYILLFQNYKKYYVGIASMHAKNPESIIIRLKKHRAKATATYPSGGRSVDHTDDKKIGWRFLAKKRFQDLSRSNSYDNLDDCYLVTINVKDHEKFIEEERKKLEYLEHTLTDVTFPVMTKIIKSISVKNNVHTWISFGKHNKGKRHRFKLITWDNEIF
tara:strand:+ start:36 stop:719 length:684 start_codon:yes stop_codon:yes gene_type:complete